MMFIDELNDSFRNSTSVVPNNTLLTQLEYLKSQNSLLQQQLTQLNFSSSNSNSTTVASNNIGADSKASANEFGNEFPFWADTHMAVAIPATLNEVTDRLLKAPIPLEFAGDTVVLKALVDGVSTHSFVAPNSLSKNQLEFIKHNGNNFVRRLFYITVATGVVK